MQCYIKSLFKKGDFHLKQIIALGGGGFSMEPENSLLDHYILSQSKKPRPRICFVGTASGDSEHYIHKFYTSFEKYECQPSHLSLFKPPTTDLESYILEKDIIFVGGGNTKNLLALWREWHLDQIMVQAWEQGIVLSGVSAGSICWFEEGLTDSFGSELQPLTCLGLLSGSNCPHYDGEAMRRPTYQRFIASGEIAPGIAADDGVALHFIDRNLHSIVSSRQAASAYSLQQENGHAVEVRLDTLFLGTP